ncbi:hypothetical protein D9M72_488170 [compost metagenome]
MLPLSMAVTTRMSAVMAVWAPGTVPVALAAKATSVPPSPVMPPAKSDQVAPPSTLLMCLVLP